MDVLATSEHLLVTVSVWAALLYWWEHILFLTWLLIFLPLPFLQRFLFVLGAQKLLREYGRRFRIMQLARHWSLSKAISPIY